MRLSTRTVTILILAGTLSSCETTQPVSRRSELLGPGKLRQLTIFTRDNLVIRAGTYHLLDSALFVGGLLQRDERWQPFADTLRLTDISYIQTTRTDGVRTVFALATAGYIVYRALNPAFSSLSSLSISPHTRYVGPGGSGGGGGGSSCPFVYSWNGKQFVLDGEAYAMAWGRQLEMTTTTLLRSSEIAGGSLRVRIANERPETHYTNSVRMRSAVVDAGAMVVPDAHGELWAVRQLHPPLRAATTAGADILDAVIRADGRMWETDLRDAGFGTAFEDGVEFHFAKPVGVETGTFIITAINTDIFGVVLQNVGDLLGDEFLTFVHTLDHDSALAATMRGWTALASLNVEVWDGSRWVRAGAVLPEANVAQFSKAVRFHHADPRSSELRVRLSALSGVWKIDAAGVDWTPSSPLTTETVSALSALDATGTDVRPLLAQDDRAYVTTLPGDGIDFVFRCQDPGPGKRLVCVLDVGGYLHEWMPPPRAAGVLARLVPGSSRIAFLRTLLHSRDMLLPPLYAEWKARREDAGQ